MAGWIAAGASIVGDIMSQQGQKATNAQNMALQMQNENWQTEMSNTAVQRRVADLKAAGINPMLAAGQAASQPTTPLATMQNPNAAFGQLGSQVSNAQLVNAQTDKLKADADLTRAQTPGTDVIPVNADGTLDYEHAPHGGVLGNLTAQQMSTGIRAQGVDIQKNQASINQINAQISNTNADTDIKTAQAIVSQLDAQTARAVQAGLIKSMNAQNAAAAAGAGNAATIKGSKAGVFIEAIDEIFGHGSGGSTIYNSGRLR